MELWAGRESMAVQHSETMCFEKSRPFHFYFPLITIVVCMCVFMNWMQVLLNKVRVSGTELLKIKLKRGNKMLV